MKNYSTQMEAAKKGIITPAMEIVAEKERMAPQEIMRKVACGEVAIPVGPLPLPISNECLIAPVTYSFASLTLSYTSCPKARLLAMLLDNVQPVPCRLKVWAVGLKQKSMSILECQGICTIMILKCKKWISR